ncbi:MAG: ribose-5-phosphate isomerase [Myxococcales bacterium]|nr:ribose-5-phosphate isomerase [Myxococcales bacterium]|tara:strand:+ start:1081 stop:2061 length:981 start_codon:yes stop_codon:yes gene_type:complete
MILGYPFLSLLKTLQASLIKERSGQVFVLMTALGAMLMPQAVRAAEFQPLSKSDMQKRMVTFEPDQTLLERLIYVSDPFLGAPYVTSPLGEGEGVDPDPRIRFDAFDCTTFVETTLALAFSPDLERAQERLEQIRYQGQERQFLNRRHFPAAEWIPELIQAGYFKDITKKVGGTKVNLQSKILNAKVWNNRRKPRHLELPDERIPSGTFSIATWPLELALENHKKIPPGTVLNVVRVNFRQMPVRVSHQGIVIRKGKRLYMRHAADRMYHSVVDEPLGRFLNRIAQYKKWPVHGINLLQIQRPYATTQGAPVGLPVSPISTKSSAP